MDGIFYLPGSSGRDLVKGPIGSLALFSGLKIRDLHFGFLNPGHDLKKLGRFAGFLYGFHV